MLALSIRTQQLAAAQQAARMSRPTKPKRMRQHQTQQRVMRQTGVKPMEPF